MSTYYQKLGRRTIRATTAERVRYLQDLLAQGLSRPEVSKILMEKYSISLSSVDHYLKLEREEMSALLSEDPTVLLEDTLSKLDSLYRSAVENGDLKAAFTVLQERTKILNLYERSERTAIYAEKPVELPPELIELMTPSKKQGNS